MKSKRQNLVKACLVFNSLNAESPELSGNVLMNAVMNETVPNPNTRFGLALMGLKSKIQEPTKEEIEEVLPSVLPLLTEGERLHLNRVFPIT